jgi:hypothetical protein
MEFRTRLNDPVDRQTLYSWRHRPEAANRVRDKRVESGRRTRENAHERVRSPNAIAAWADSHFFGY